MLDLGKENNVNSLLSSGFVNKGHNTFTKQVGDLDICVNETTIVINNTISLETESLESNEENLNKVLVMGTVNRVYESLDLSIPSEEEDSSEVENKALVNKDEEFMSQGITVNDFRGISNIEIINFTNGIRFGFGSLHILFELDRKLYLQHGRTTLKTLKNPTRKQVDEVYHFFTGEHLDFSPKQEVYNWKSCFDWNGWFINGSSTIYKSSSTDTSYVNRDVYPTKEDAEAALAHCQLLHVANKINEDYPKGKDDVLNFQIYYHTKFGGFYPLPFGSTEIVISSLILHSKEGANVLIRDNEQLLKTYFKIK